MRRRQLRHGAWRRAAPLIMGVALLAWLGGAAAEPRPGDLELVALPRIDVGAHLFGFVVGLGIGLALGAPMRPPLQGRRAQFVLAASAIASIVLAWVFALGRR